MLVNLILQNKYVQDKLRLTRAGDLLPGVSGIHS